MRLQLDHLVVAAASLEQGARWCEATFGVAPGPGGKHPLMGTHNRLLRIDAPAFPRAYLEIIAIDPDAAVPARTRWFDLDDVGLRAAIEVAPRLIHWVARCDELDATCAAWRERGIDRGVPVAASRETANGRLRWRITVRADGQRLFEGALPTLIEWGSAHPVEAMPPSPLRLESLAVGGLPAWIAPALPVHTALRTAPGLRASFASPRGVVTLDGALP